MISLKFLTGVLKLYIICNHIDVNSWYSKYKAAWLSLNGLMDHMESFVKKTFIHLSYMLQRKASWLGIEGHNSSIKITRMKNKIIRKQSNTGL